MDFEALLEKLHNKLDALSAEQATIKVMVASLLEQNKFTQSRIDREIEIAKGIHEGHDTKINNIDKMLKGNGVKGLVERVGDTEDGIKDLKKDMDEKFTSLSKAIDEKFVENVKTQRSTMRTVLLSAISIVLGLIITRIF